MDRIDYNIETSSIKVEAGLDQLREIKRNNEQLLLFTALLLCVFSFFFIPSFPFFHVNILIFFLIGVVDCRTMVLLKYYFSDLIKVHIHLFLFVFNSFIFYITKVYKNILIPWLGFIAFARYPVSESTHNNQKIIFIKKGKNA